VQPEPAGVLTDRAENEEGPPGAGLPIGDRRDSFGLPGAGRIAASIAFTSTVDRDRYGSLRQPPLAGGERKPQKVASRRPVAITSSTIAATTSR